MKTLLIFLFLVAELNAAQKQMVIRTKIFRNTASLVFPTLDFEEGETATLKINYDDQTVPQFTGKVLLQPNGTPQFNSNQEISYDSNIRPNEPTSNASQYTITGQITLEIDGHIWTGTNSRLLIYNNMPTVTVFDGISIESTLVSPALLQNIEVNFKLQLRSIESSDMIFSTALPTATENILTDKPLFLNFAIRPRSGASWVISSNILDMINVNDNQN